MSCYALAQEAQPSVPLEPGANPPPATQAPAPPAFRPGFIDAVRRWFGQSKAVVDSSLQDTQETLGGIGSQATGAVKDAAGAAQQATGVVVGLPGTRIVTGRQRCPLAPNGAPDCAPAADALCQAKGFKAGRGLDVSSADKCPTRVLLTGRAPEKGECYTETFVSRAVCQ